MVTTIYLVRHGETDANVQDVPQGLRDVPLNSRGRAQAEAVARWFAFSGGGNHAVARWFGFGGGGRDLDPACRWADAGVPQGRRGRHRPACKTLPNTRLRTGRGWGSDWPILID